MDKEKEFILSRSVSIDGQPVSKLTVKELTGADILEIEHEVMTEGGGKDYGTIGSAERVMRLAARATGVLFDDVKKFSARDIATLGEMVNDFL